MKAGSQPGNSKADGDSVVVKIGPSTIGGSPVHRSPRGLTNKKPSSSPLQERSLLIENKKRKVHPAKVNKGVKTVLVSKLKMLFLKKMILKLILKMNL